MQMTKLAGLTVTLVALVVFAGCAQQQNRVAMQQGNDNLRLQLASAQEQLDQTRGELSKSITQMATTQKYLHETAKQMVAAAQERQAKRREIQLAQHNQDTTADSRAQLSAKLRQQVELQTKTQQELDQLAKQTAGASQARKAQEARINRLAQRVRELNLQIAKLQHQLGMSDNNPQPAGK